jgi:hypothetical protein
MSFYHVCGSFQVRVWVGYVGLCLKAARGHGPVFVERRAGTRISVSC